MNRRELLKTSLLLASTAAIGTLNAQANELLNTPIIKPQGTKKRVIIIGGGFSGLSVAKSLAIENKECEILVFEQKNLFVSCPFSNLWLTTNNLQYEDLIGQPIQAAQKFGYQLINQKVEQIDRLHKTIKTSSEVFSYDLLVIATGIEYDYTSLFSNAQDAHKCQTLYPPSYQGGNEQVALKDKIQQFKEGVFVINVPKNSYRCPPAPYERACLIANLFKQKKLNAKVILLDPRDKPAAKPKGFIKAFEEYKGYLEYHPSSIIKNIDLQTKTIEMESFNEITKKFEKKEIVFDDANFLPNNKGSFLLKNCGLELTQEGYARAKNPTFRTSKDDDIYVVGDVLGEYPFPKSAQMAISCGIILANQIHKRLSGLVFEESADMAGNVCYSFINEKEAISVYHYSAYTKENGLKVTSQTIDSADEAQAQAAKNWFAGIKYNLFE